LLAVAAGALLVPAGGAAAGEARGVVAAVDPAKKELRVDGRGADRGTTLTFTLDDKTLVLFGPDKAAPADLPVGRRVRVEFEEGPDGRRVARVVRARGRRPGPRPAATGPAPAAAAGDVVTGVLQRVARTDREVVVIGPGAKGPETETTVAVPEGAKVFKDGKPASLEALKEGDPAAIRVERKGGRATALEVQAGPGAALSASPAPERRPVIPRLRQALHIADEVLRQLDPEDAGREGPKKP
jgi:hypothetical protein